MRRGIFLNVTELKPESRKSKRSRIRGVQPYFQRGEVFIQRTEDKFITQYKQFPTGKLVDILDIFAYGPHQWGLPDIDPTPEEEYEELMEEQRGFIADGRSESTGY